MLSLALAALIATGPVETPVSVPTDRAPLHATLTTPDAPTRAVAVIIPGSGPTDRDGNQPPAVRAGYLRQLAHALAGDGIATVRIDKRGVGASAFAAGAEADLRFDDYAVDAYAWAEEAVRLTGQPCAWLIGHSEGAMVALAASRLGSDAVCGLLLLAGPGRPGGEILREQLGGVLPEPLRGQALAAVTELEAGRTTEAPAELAALFRASVQPYLISWLALDPAEMVAAYDGPIFIGQGTTDIQVGVVDAQRMAAVRPDATLAIWDGVNHVLKIAPADRAANTATYADPDLPLAPGVAEDVAEFILTPR